MSVRFFLCPLRQSLGRLILRARSDIIQSAHDSNCARAEEALDFIFKKGSYTDVPTPAIMLLDLKMPKMDGFEVLESIKKSDQYKRIPIIVLTTSDREQDIQRAYDLGCNSYIVKPVNFESFIKAVIEIHQYWLIQCKIPLETSMIISVSCARRA